MVFRRLETLTEGGNSLNMIKLVAFDWNGTIFSDASTCCEAVNEVLKFLKLKPVSLKTYREHFDVPVTRTYLGLGISQEQIDSKSTEIVKTFHTNYEIRATKVRTRAYTRELLEWLSKNNIESIIFSNHIDEPIKRQLKRLKLEKYFSLVIANSELHTSLNGRNKQEKLKDYIQSKKLLPNEVLIIGDTVEEIEIGKELGVTTVAITQGFCSTARLKAVNPEYLINSLKEVMGIIKSV